jgi:hypothetical protein
MKHIDTFNGVPSLLHRWFDMKALNITISPIIGKPHLLEQRK